MEWAVGWSIAQEGFVQSYCNTIVTPQGGTHEAGFRNALLKGLRNYGELTNNKKAAQITGDDVLNGACTILSVFIPNPQFQGQTKEKLVNSEVSRLVENAIRDHFDQWLSGNKQLADAILNYIIERAEERLSRKAQQEVNRKSPTQR